MAFGQLPFPFMSGVASTTTSLVPDPFDVAIAGRPYLLDLAAEWGHESIPLMRVQADQSATPGEASLNPDDLWRRSQDSWHHGAGQTHFDREDSDPQRFRSSKGIDPWTRWEICLLADTVEKYDSANTNLKLAVAGSRIYVVDGTALKYTADITAGTPTFTTVTGTSGSTITDIATDGFNVYVVDGSDIYSTNTGVSTASAYNTLDADVIDYVKGRWMVGHDNSLYNVTSTTPPSALMTQANSDFSWVGCAEGRGFIYAGGQSGDKALIYRITVKDDASSLDAPVIAGELPDGETLLGIGGYLGYVFLGTDAGVRFCDVDSAGNLLIGSPQGGPSRCFEGQESFVWFGWDNYDTVSTGLGRLDLRVLTDDAAQTPAYASDLMVTAQAEVVDVATFQSRRVFAVSGEGVYISDTDKVASGSLDTGLISYGLPHTKSAMFVDMTFGSGFAGSHSLSIATDDSSSFTAIGTVASTNQDTSKHTYAVDSLRGEYHELRHTLTRDGSDATLCPRVLRATLRVIPSAGDGGGEWIIWPVILADTVDANIDYRMDPAFELDEIKALRQSRQVVTAQELAQSYRVAVEDYEWKPHHVSKDRASFAGTCFVKLRKVV